MKNLKSTGLLLSVLVMAIMVSAYTFNVTTNRAEEGGHWHAPASQMANLFVTHGHCSTPFAGAVRSFNLSAHTSADEGNPLENMRLTFAIDPHTFEVCANKELTASVRTPGLFINENADMLTFRSTHVYTMGMDWYQVNGMLSIKGVEREAKFFVTGIRQAAEPMPAALVLQCQISLYDWGIDYDKIINGEAAMHPSQWMYIHMKIELV